MPSSPLHEPILNWYAGHARVLPWRAVGTSPWAVLVSEVMLQQTPVSRVLPVFEEWLERWPVPADLAAVAPGEAVRAWGRLGYPRRALRLHAAASTIGDRYDGVVPSSYDELLSLPGVGSYTAAAVASFAFAQRHAVLDTNVRRVLARLVTGAEQPPPTSTPAERGLAERLLPDEDEVAARWGVAVMELGAIICTARNPRCAQCPVVAECRWSSTGRPAYTGARRLPQRWAGTDRQVRGLVLARLRRSTGPVALSEVAALWPDREQLERALNTLCSDRLVESCAEGYALPGEERQP